MAAAKQRFDIRNLEMFEGAAWTDIAGLEQATESRTHIYRQ